MARGLLHHVGMPTNKSFDGALPSIATKAREQNLRRSEKREGASDQRVQWHIENLPCILDCRWRFDRDRGRHEGPR